MTDEQFSKGEAVALLGSRVEAAYDFPSVPAGTTGTAKRIKAIEGGFAITVEWDRAKQRKQYFALLLDLSINISLQRPDPPITDDFTKVEFTRLLRRMPVRRSQRI